MSTAIVVLCIALLCVACFVTGHMMGWNSGVSALEEYFERRMRDERERDTPEGLP